jgi:RimJ/RimL family protein N-acetyltransferase
MEIRLERSLLRPWTDADAGSLARHANDRRVWINLRDTFPHPYTVEDALSWFAKMRALQRAIVLAIDVDGEAVGGIGVFQLDDVYSRSGEIGYWIGHPFWNRGIVSEAVNALTEFAFRELDLVRVQAGVFGWNAASMRVLEKCGYAREGVLRKSVHKDGRLVDSVLYARIRD